MRVLAVLLAGVVFVPALRLHAATLEPLGPAAPAVRKIGFELEPPRGEQWFVYRPGPAGEVTFRKKDARREAAEGKESVFVIEVKAEIFRKFDLTTASGLQAALEYALFETPERMRYEPPRLEPFAWQGTDCIRYQAARTEPGPAGQPSLHTEVEGFFCRHPHDPKVAVIGLFQERRPLAAAPMLDDALRTEARAVLESTRFLRID